MINLQLKCCGVLHRSDWEKSDWSGSQYVSVFAKYPDYSVCFPLIGSAKYSRIAKRFLLRFGAMYLDPKIFNYWETTIASPALNTHFYYIRHLGRQMRPTM